MLFQNLCMFYSMCVISSFASFVEVEVEFVVHLLAQENEQYHKSREGVGMEEAEAALKQLAGCQAADGRANDCETWMKLMPLS